MAPNADGCVGPRGPGKGLGDKLGSRNAEIQPAVDGGGGVPSGDGDATVKG